MHGEYRHLQANARLASELGIEKDNIFIMSSGDVLELDENSAKLTDHVQTGAIYVDGLGVGDVGNIVLRDRQHLAEEYSNQILAGPDIISRGFVYVREAESLIEEAKMVVEEALEGCLSRGICDWSKLKNVVKDSLNEYLWKKTKRSPMILPIIMEV